MAIAAPLIELKGVQAQQDSTLQNTMALKMNGSAEQIKVYYIQAKDGIIEIVGAVNDKVVLIKAKMFEVASSAHSTTVAHLEQAKIFVRAKTAWIQNGYVFITVKMNNQVVRIMAKTSEVLDLVKDKMTDSIRFVHCKAAVCRDTVTAKASKALQPMKPYYVKVHDGVAHIVAMVGNKVLLIQARVSDMITSVQVQFVKSATTARAAIERLSSPLVTRAVGLQKTMANKVEHFVVSIENGTIRVRAAIGERVVLGQGKISELVGTIRLQTSKGLTSTKSTITDLTTKILMIVSGTYDQACASSRLVYTRSKDGVLYVFCQVNERFVLLKIKASEIIEVIRSKSMQLCETSYTTMLSGCARGRAALVDSCASLKEEMLRASKITKAKSLQLTANARDFAGNRQTRVTAVSAAGGALAAGAGGGAAGLVAGGGLGVGFGVVLAPFTLGLSIPVGAALGAGTGLCVGTAAGGTAGLITCGAVGYGAQKHKDEIGNGVHGAMAKVKTYKAIASEKTNRLCTRVMGHTGGTAFA